jgi:hypothetical protein
MHGCAPEERPGAKAPFLMCLFRRAKALRLILNSNSNSNSKSKSKSKSKAKAKTKRKAGPPPSAKDDNLKNNNKD